MQLAKYAANQGNVDDLLRPSQSLFMKCQCVSCCTHGKNTLRSNSKHSWFKDQWSSLNINVTVASSTPTSPVTKIASSKLPKSHVHVVRDKSILSKNGKSSASAGCMHSDITDDTVSSTFCTSMILYLKHSR